MVRGGFSKNPNALAALGRDPIGNVTRNRSWGNGDWGKKRMAENSKRANCWRSESLRGGPTRFPVVAAIAEFKRLRGNR
jgi:hypothetical protein